jgi:flagellar hook-associated protein 2
MAMSVSGLGSNLDIAGIVSQLMEVERQPLKALSTKEAGFQAKISAFGSIKSALATLQYSAASMRVPAGSNALDFYSSYKGSLTDESIATVTAGEGSVPGNYSLSVSRLAQQNRLASTPSNTIGTGTLTIKLGNENGTNFTKSTSVNITNNSLTGVRDAINNANAGVTAAVINGKDGAQLVITSESGGSNQFIHLSGVSGLNYAPGNPPTNFTQQQAAQSALFEINGIALESQGNKVTTALEGLTIELKKETTGTPTTLTISRDTSSLNRSLDKMVTAFNDFNKLSKELGGVDASTGKLGTLGGDASLRSANSQVRQALYSVSPELSAAKLRTLSDIGISIQLDGSLKLDTIKLEKAIASDFVGVAKVASSFSSSLDKTITGLTGSTGSLTGKTEGIQNSIKGIALRRTEMERRLVDIEARYKKQYTTLDTLVSRMLQTSTYLEQQLANLPGASS